MADGETGGRREHIVVVVALIAVDPKGFLDGLEAAFDIIISSHHASP